MSTDFELSRIYAQGWNTALKPTPQQRAVLEAHGVAALNPYHDDGRERTRWAEGFDRAMGAATPSGPAGRRGKSA
jgi:hypothetical protein